MTVNFFNEDIIFNFKQKGKIRNWIRDILQEEQISFNYINIIATSDSYLRKLNEEFLYKDYFTDIITFYDESNGKISGELFISIDRINDNADKFNVTFDHELKRVIAHGILHLCGYDDSSNDEIIEIRAKEDYYLSCF